MSEQCPKACTCWQDRGGIILSWSCPALTRYTLTHPDVRTPLATTAHDEQEARTTWRHLYGFAPDRVVEGWP